MKQGIRPVHLQPHAHRRPDATPVIDDTPLTAITASTRNIFAIQNTSFNNADAARSIHFNIVNNVSAVLFIKTTAIYHSS